MDDQAALSQPLGDVGVAEAAADVPADGQGDHGVVEAAPGEGAGRAGGEPARDSLQRQRCPPSRVRQSRLVLPLPHRMHGIVDPFPTHLKPAV